MEEGISWANSYASPVDVSSKSFIVPITAGGHIAPTVDRISQLSCQMAGSLQLARSFPTGSLSLRENSYLNWSQLYCLN